MGSSASEEQLRNLPPVLPVDPEHSHIVTYEEIKTIADEPIKQLLPSHLKVLILELLKLDLAIVQTTTKPGFITSDDPCVWFDPEGYRHPWPYQGPALIYRSIEIHLPISPSQCLLFNRRGYSEYIFLKEFGPLVDSQVVAETNWRTCNEASDYIVVNDEIILWDWFFYQ